MSTTGIEIGMPEPFLNRVVRATSNVRAVRGTASRIRQTFAVVPPMSNDTTRSSPWRRASPAAKIAPPAGPDSISRTGNAIASASDIRPPPECTSRIGQATPCAPSAPSSRSR